MTKQESKKQAKPTTPPSPEPMVNGVPLHTAFSNLEETLKKLSDLPSRVKDLADELLKLKSFVHEIQSPAKEAPSAEAKSTIAETAITDHQNEIVELVKNILGNGRVEDCQFQVNLQPGDAGVSFKLLIIPPEHLKENPDDKRMKMIPYLEAEAGARAYAEQVRNFCLAYASRMGRSYIV